MINKTEKTTWGTIALFAVAVMALSILAMGVAAPTDGDVSLYNGTIQGNVQTTGDNSQTYYGIQYTSPDISGEESYLASVTDAEGNPVIEGYMGFTMPAKWSNNIYIETGTMPLEDGVYEVTILCGNTPGEESTTTLFQGPVIIGAVGITLNSGDQELVISGIGKTSNVDVEIEPSEYTPEVSLVSGNPGVVSYQENLGEHQLVSVGVGSTTVTASFTYNGQTYSDTISVNVVSEPVTNFVISGDTTITKGESTNLVISNIQPSGATGSVEWKVSEGATIQAASDGMSAVVTGVEVGAVTVTATIGTVSIEHYMTVEAEKLGDISITSDGNTVPYNGTLQLSCNVSGNAYYTVAWDSNNPSIISVDDKGVASGCASTGSATITVTVTNVDDESDKKTGSVELSVLAIQITGAAILSNGQQIPDVGISLSPGDSGTYTIQANAPIEGEPTITGTDGITISSISKVDEYSFSFTVSADADITGTRDCEISITLGDYTDGDGYQTSVSVTISEVLYTVSASLSGYTSGATMSPAGSFKVKPGASQTFTVTVEDGYAVSGWEVTGATAIPAYDGNTTLLSIDNISNDVDLDVSIVYVGFPSTGGDDEEEFLPPIPPASEEEDDTTTYIAVIAAAAVVALLAIIILMERRK